MRIVGDMRQLSVAGTADRVRKPSCLMPIALAAAGLGLQSLLLAAPAVMAMPPSMPAAALPRTSMPAMAPAAEPATVHEIAVFGTDNRTKLPKRLEALRNSIGLLYNERSRTVCTAFCIADDVLATASHCLFRTRGETPPPADSFYFSRPGTAHPNVRLAGSASRAAAQQILAGTIGISTKPPIDAARDWAMLKLQSPACRGRTLGIQPLTPDDIEREASAGKLYQAAYHRDFGRWTMAYSEPCMGGRRVEGAGGPVTERDFTDSLNLVLHTCDTGGASSGSPLLIETPAGPQVVAINVGTFVQSRVVLEEGVVVRRAPAKPVANTAVSAVAFASRLERFRSAIILTARAEVLELQHRLSALNLLTGLLDGRFDIKLRTAIEAYESQQGMPVMGLPTRALLQTLQSAAAVPARPNASAPRSR